MNRDTLSARDRRTPSGRSASGKREVRLGGVSAWRFDPVPQSSESTVP